MFTRFQDFYPPTLSLHSIDIITLRLSTHSPFQKECAITVLNSIELLWLHVITYIHTCNIAQNWKSIVEEITRDRFTLADLFHETRATYRKRVIKTVLRDSLYNTKRYRSCYFSTRYAWWALLLSVRGPWWTWIATVLPYIFNNRFVFSFIKPAYYSRERKYTGNDREREREQKGERGEKRRKNEGTKAKVEERTMDRAISGRDISS